MMLSGQNEALAAFFKPVNATVKDVSWTTSDAGVAVVSSSGLVTAVSAGTATITVTTADGNWTDTCTVTVISVHVVAAAAARLAETQNSDGGWEWLNPDTDPLTGVPSPFNTLGVTAQGLLSSHRSTPNAAYLQACQSTYQALLANSASPTPSVHKIRGTDLTFLVGLSEATGDSTYAEFARTRYQATLAEFGGGTATGLALYVRGVRLGQPSYIAWDTNLYVRGAVALESYFPGQGFGADAEAMAEVIYAALYESPVDFQVEDQTQDSYWMSIAAVVESFALTGVHPAEREALTSSLIASQHADGHFGDPATSGLVQTTAYAVYALVRTGSQGAALGGVSYLAGAQGTSGGWQESGGSENTEVDSEALHAIHAFVERF